jgi:hypothetical protein
MKKEFDLQEHKNKALNIADVRRSVTITIPLEVAETLQGLIDGSIGSSDSNYFNKEMAVVLKKLDKQVSKHYA